MDHGKYPKDHACPVPERRLKLGPVPLIGGCIVNNMIRYSGILCQEQVNSLCFWPCQVSKPGHRDDHHNP